MKYLYLLFRLFKCPHRESPSEREPDSFCVWCNDPYYVGDTTFTHPQTREVHCSQKCLEDYDANQ